METTGHNFYLYALLWVMLLLNMILKLERKAQISNKANKRDIK